MSIFSISVSYRQADVDLRGRLTVPAHRVEDILRDVVAVDGIDEAVILCTCNRVEIHAASNGVGDAGESTGNGDPAGAMRLLRFLADTRGVSIDEVESVATLRVGPESVRHLFRVAAALDSMVFGEAQILGQLKSAYGAATEAGAVGPRLHYLFQRAFALAKKDRNDMHIGCGRVSVASIAVDAAAELFDGLHGRGVAVIGTGKMGRAALRYLRDRGVGRIWIVSRTRGRAAETARDLHDHDAVATDWSGLDDALDACDILISSTGCPAAIVGAERLGAAMRRRSRRPLMVMDLAVPRDVDPAARAIDGIHLHDLDALGEVAARAADRRREDLEKAQRVVDRNVDLFVRKAEARATAAQRAAGANPQPPVRAVGP